MMEYALVTGASKGIGKAFATELAKRNCNLLLVARSESTLSKISEQLSKQYAVEVRFLAVDLSLPTVPGQIAEWCVKNGYGIKTLVNNAGFGLWGAFHNLSLSEQLNMMQLNMSSLVALTHHLIPLLQKNRPSHILNVASVASYLAIPNFSIYAATKAFVLSFSRSLRIELSRSGVSVSCVCPGATESEFLERAGMEALGKKAGSVNMTAEEVASVSIKCMLRGKAEIIPGFINKVAVNSIKLAPKELMEAVAGKIYAIRETG